MARNVSKAVRAVLHRSFLSGIGSIADPYPLLDTPRSTLKNDRDALTGDWKAVGNDIRKAIESETRRGKVARSAS